MDKTYIFLAIYTFIIVAYVTNFQFIIFGDNSLPQTPSFLSTFSVWQPLCSPSGCYQFLWGISASMIYLIKYFILYFSYPIAYFVGLWLPYLISAISMYMLMQYLMRDYDQKIRAIAAISAVIIFTGHFSVSIGDQQYLMMFFPLAILFYFKFLEDKDRKNFILAAFFFGIQISINNIAYLPQDMILVFIICAYGILSSKNQAFQLKYAILMILIVTIINLPTWFNVGLLGSQSFGDYFSTSSYKSFYIFGYSLPFSVFSFLPAGNNVFFTTFIRNSPDAIIGGTIILFISLLAVASRRKGMLFLGGCAVAIIIVGTTVYLPFGIFQSLLTSANILYILRLPYVALHIYSLMIISILFGVGMGILFARRSRLVLLGLVMVVNYLFFFIVYLNAGQSTSLPSYYFDTASYINANRLNNTGVAILPVQATYASTNSYLGVNIYTDLINAPVYNGGENAQSINQFSQGSQLPYYNVSFPFQINNNAESVSGFIAYLNSQDIQYVIVDSSASFYNEDYYVYALPSEFSINTININLDILVHEGLLKEVQTIGNETLYENPNAYPTFIQMPQQVKQFQRIADITLVLQAVALALLLLAIPRKVKS